MSDKECVESLWKQEAKLGSWLNGPPVHHVQAHQTDFHCLLLSTKSSRPPVGAVGGPGCA